MLTHEVNELSSTRILGTRIHIVENPGVAQIMDHWIRKEPDVCHYVVNTGMHGIITAHREPSFKEVLNSADLFAPDGIFVTLLARLKGFSIDRANTGPALMWEFGKIANQSGHKYFIYGDTDDTCQALAVKLHQAFPGIRLVGQYSPPFRDLTQQEDDDVVKMINEAQPDVLWVGLGAPKQERWMYEHQRRLKVPVVVGVGAAFKYHSGVINRAPRWIRKSSLEWLWRLGQEPRRVWRRVFLDAPQFLLLVALEMLGIRKYD